MLQLQALPFYGTNLVLNFTAMSNHSYSVQFQSPLGAATWQKWQDVPAVSSNGVVWLTNGMNPATNGFFRLATPVQP